MPESPLRNWLVYVTLAVFGFTLPPVCVAESDSKLGALPRMEEGWKDASLMLFNDANQIFEKQKVEGEAERRERELGLAVTLLNAQPRTRNNLDRARSLLEELASGSEERVAIFATYFLARLEVFYESPPRLDRARTLYRGLIERHAGHPLAEHSAAELVFVDLYDAISGTERESRFSELEKLAPLLKTTSGLRNYHLNMGNAYIDFGTSGAKALEHLLAADAQGITRWQIETATWIAIGELANAEGERDRAIDYYRKFLEKYRRDNRHHTIRERLEAILASDQHQ